MPTASLFPPAVRRQVWFRLLRILGGLAGAIFLLWLMIAQPSCRRLAPGPGTARPDRLEADVRTLVHDFFPRHDMRPDNLARAADWIEDEFAAAGLRTRRQPFEVGRSTYFNVIGEAGPEGPAAVIVGAHYDTFSALPGADDNASGVAGLLELARLFRDHPPARPVHLVAFCLEEPPHFRTPNMGSARFVAALDAEARDALEVAIVLEMIGYFSDEPGSQRYPMPLLRLFYPGRGDSIVLVGHLGSGGLLRRAKAAMRGASPLPVHSARVPRWVPGVDFSDHLNFWRAGLPAFMVTDTAFYRNPHYHTRHDTPDTLDYARMAHVVTGIHQAAHKLASP